MSIDWACLAEFAATALSMLVARTEMAATTAARIKAGNNAILSTVMSLVREFMAYPSRVWIDRLRLPDTSS
jgi:hypothetical protein